MTLWFCSSNSRSSTRNSKNNSTFSSSSSSMAANSRVKRYADCITLHANTQPWCSLPAPSASSSCFPPTQVQNHSSALVSSYFWVELTMGRTLSCSCISAPRPNQPQHYNPISTKMFFNNSLIWVLVLTSPKIKHWSICVTSPLHYNFISPK